MRLATGIPAANYAGIKEEERIGKRRGIPSLLIECLAANEGIVPNGIIHSF